MRLVSKVRLACTAFGSLLACSSDVSVVGPDTPSSDPDAGTSSDPGDPGAAVDATQPSPGSVVFTTPGTGTFVVPPFQRLTVEAWGAGGAGGRPYDNSLVPSGGDTTFGTELIARGGQGGSFNAGGSGGIGIGGTIFLSGGNGAPSSGYYGGPGGAAPRGGAGGIGGVNESGMIPPAYPPTSGGSPGGGGGGHGVAGPGGPGPGAHGGGAGGYVARAYLPQELPPGSTVMVTVGRGGALTFNGYVLSGAGGDGAVAIQWQ
jgi:hypothetical protein